jgi:hypothetical protein
LFSGLIATGFSVNPTTRLTHPCPLAAAIQLGIPVQTLHRIASVAEFPGEVGVDGLVDYLRANVYAWQHISYVDQMFVKRALGIAQDFAWWVAAELQANEARTSL